MGELSESCLSGKQLQQNCPNSACQEKRFREIARILPVRINASGKLPESCLSGKALPENCPNSTCQENRFREFVRLGIERRRKMGKAVASTTCLSCLWAEAVGKVHCWERRRSERGRCMLPGSDRLERHRCATRSRLYRIFYDSQIAKEDCVT